MSGIVVVAGVFEPGSVVRLTGVLDETVLRPEGGEDLGRKLVDDNGNVGWDDLTIGGRYFVSGYVNGIYAAVRCIGTDSEAPDTPLSQAPIQPSAQRIGTQEAPAVTVTPELPEDHEDLEVGLPEGVGTGILTPPEPSLQEELFIDVGAAEVDPAAWQPSGLQTPAVTAADGTLVGAQPLYRYVGDAALLATGQDWQRYQGATEPVPVTPAPEPPVLTPEQQAEADAKVAAQPTPPAEPAPVDPAPPEPPKPEPPVDAVPPPVADVPPPTQPVPSESAGTGDQAGAPSEQAAATDPAVAAPVGVPAPSTDAPPAPADNPPAEAAPAADASAPAADAAAPAPPAAPPTSAPAEVTAAPDAASPVPPAATDGGAGATSEAPAPADQPPAPDAAPAAPEAPAVAPPVDAPAAPADPTSPAAPAAGADPVAP